MNPPEEQKYERRVGKRGALVHEPDHPKPLPLPLAFERLAKASKGRWEGVDASDFVHGLREGGKKKV